MTIAVAARRPRPRISPTELPALGILSCTFSHQGDIRPISIGSNSLRNFSALATDEHGWTETGDATKLFDGSAGSSIRWTLV